VGLIDSSRDVLRVLYHAQRVALVAGRWLDRPAIGPDAGGRGGSRAGGPKDGTELAWLLVDRQVDGVCSQAYRVEVREETKGRGYVGA
jgi:hypothetical protein